MNLTVIDVMNFLILGFPSHILKMFYLIFCCCCIIIHGKNTVTKNKLTIKKNVKIFNLFNLKFSIN